MEELITSLHRIDAIKFGSFTLKSGIESPIYIDLRVIVSYPGILKTVAESLWAKMDGLSFDVLCGVPYTALPMATALSLDHHLPMVMRRKEVKDYGTKRAIEGAITPGQRCLIIEDLVTSGMSVLETVRALESVELSCSDVVVLLDREQGAAGNLAECGLQLHSVFRMSQLLEVLHRRQLIDSAMLTKVENFLKQQSQVNANV